MVLNDLEQNYWQLISLVENNHDQKCSQKTPGESIFENIPADFSLEMKLKTVIIKSAISMLSLLVSLPSFSLLQPQIVIQLERKGVSPELLHVLRGKFVDEVEQYL